jgi:hypothetical protein
MGQGKEEMRRAAEGTNPGPDPIHAPWTEPEVNASVFAIGDERLQLSIRRALDKWAGVVV